MGALHLQLAEEDRRRNYRLRNADGAVVDIVVIPGSRNVIAESALIELTEDGAPHQLSLAVFYTHTIEQARSQTRPGGLDIISIGFALIFAHGDEFGLELFRG